MQYGQANHCHEYFPKDAEICPDFTECILASIPNMVIERTDAAKASKKLGSNARKISQIVGCEDGYVPARRNMDEGQW